MSWQCSCGTGDCVSHEVNGDTITYYMHCRRSYWVDDPPKKEVPLTDRRACNTYQAGCYLPIPIALCGRWPPIARARGPPIDGQLLELPFFLQEPPIDRHGAKPGGD